MIPLLPVGPASTATLLSAMYFFSRSAWPQFSRIDVDVAAGEALPGDLFLQVLRRRPCSRAGSRATLADHGRVGLVADPRVDRDVDGLASAGARSRSFAALALDDSPPPPPEHAASAGRRAHRAGDEPGAPAVASSDLLLVPPPRRTRHASSATLIGAATSGFARSGAARARVRARPVVAGPDATSARGTVPGPAAVGGPLPANPVEHDPQQDDRDAGAQSPCRSPRPGRTRR